MQGRRIPLTSEGLFDADPQPGDYGRINRTLAQVYGYETQLWWNVWAPDGSSCTLNPEIHAVVEHEDGAVTVTPSIVTSSWHGWLTNGVWKVA